MKTFNNITLEFSDSGKILTIKAENSRPVAELFIYDSKLLQAAINATEDKPIKHGFVNIFRGDVESLMPGEFLDVANESIIENDVKNKKESIG